MRKFLGNCRLTLAQSAPGLRKFCTGRLAQIPLSPHCFMTLFDSLSRHLINKQIDVLLSCQNCVGASVDLPSIRAEFRAPYTQLSTGAISAIEWVDFVLRFGRQTLNTARTARLGPGPKSELCGCCKAEE